jgi:hypothetical protein
VAGNPPTTDRPGTRAAPRAAAGHLCIYEGFNASLDATFQDPATASSGGTVQSYGAVVVGNTDAAGAYISSGGWAVTAS